MNSEILHFSNMYIVLVESSYTQSKPIKRQLNLLGINSVKVAKDGRQGLDLLAQDRPDLVISAMYLADMTGTDLIMSIRNNESLADSELFGNLF